MDQVSLIPIGGVGTVTKNMYLYEYKDQVLIVDCGLGFADQTMPGVDLLIPDITYLKNSNKKIIGMVLTHGHEDHIGALPFILPNLPDFPIYGSMLTASLATEKLSEFNIRNRVQIANYDQEIQLGPFRLSLIHVTHSILDAAHIFIRTPIGNFYHGSDFKFDFTPVDGKQPDMLKMAKLASEGVLCLLEDCVGVERRGHSRSENSITESYEEEFRRAKGKIFVTTYSSNISRLNQAIEVGVRLGRKFCFVGRSLLRSRDVGRSLKYMQYQSKFEIKPHEIKRYKPSEVLILITGAQAQESSALVRIANDEDQNLQIGSGDTVIFSADPIPGNEVSVNALIDTLAKRGAKVVYYALTDEFHVSGHGSENDVKLLMSLVRGQHLIPIGGTYRQMVVYRDIARAMGYSDNKIILPDNGQSINFTKTGYSFGKKQQLANIFIDEVTGEAVESYLVVDRQKISKEGVVIIMVDIDPATGQLVGKLDVLARGFVHENKEQYVKKLEGALQNKLQRRVESVTNWGHLKKIIGDTAENLFIQEGREPLVVPVILEV